MGVATVILSHFEQGTIGVFIVKCRRYHYHYLNVRAHTNLSYVVRWCLPYRSGYTYLDLQFVTASLYTQDVTGGLFLRPIPGHMLQTVETTPQVSLTSDLRPRHVLARPFPSKVLNHLISKW